MAPELLWIKDAADIIQSAGPYGGIAGLVYLLKIQRDEWNKERASFSARWDARNEEMKDHLRVVTSTATDAISAIREATDVTKEQSRLMQGGLDVLRLLPGQMEQTLSGVERNFNYLTSHLTGGRK